MANQDRMDEAISRAMRSGRDEPPLISQVIESFHGSTWWVNVLGMPIMLGFMVLWVYSAVRFFGASEVRELILWATTFLFCALTVSMFKVWYWMLLNRNAIAREVKRLELQVARLSEGGRGRE